MTHRNCKGWDRLSCLAHVADVDRDSCRIEREDRLRNPAKLTEREPVPRSPTDADFAAVGVVVAGGADAVCASAPQKPTAMAMPFSFLALGLDAQHHPPPTGGGSLFAVARFIARNTFIA